nr:hypothetical protein [uncultured Roseateles sp.]
MTDPTLPALALRASILSLALATAMPVLAASDGGIKEICVKPEAGATNATPSDAEVKAPLTTVDLVFVTAQFKKPGLAQQEPDEEWVDWKIDDITRLVTDRAPKLLRANGLEGQVVVLPPVAVGDEPDFSSLDAARPALVFVPIKYAKWRPNLLATMAGAITYAVELRNAGPGAPQPKCHVEVWGGFGFDSVWGRAKTNRADAEWVDSRVTGALTALARQGVVKLSGEKAVRPAD